MNRYVLVGLKVIFWTAIVVWFAVLLSHKIDLTTADLGRHIRNGNVIVHGTWQEKMAVLHTNFYSYTLPDQPFVNHHWLSGVVFYVVHQLWGFVGLSVFYVLLGVVTLALFFDVARRASNFWIASASTIIAVPLIASRAEVRPEMFTYLFTGVFFWVLSVYRIKKQESGIMIDVRILWILPLVMLFWVNLHIGFIFGFLVLGVFLAEQGIKDLSLKIKDKAPFSKQLSQLFFVTLCCILAALINPFGYKLLLYPLNIFKNYGYTIVENQSIRFLERLNFTQGQHFLLFKIVAGTLGIMFLGVLIKNWRKFPLADFVLVGVSGVMAYLGIRHFPSFGFFVIPALAATFYIILPKNIHVAYKSAISAMVIAIVMLSLSSQYRTFQELKPVLGWGLLPGVNGSAEFFIDHNIQGPIINDYDIGGYLIYHLNNLSRPSGALPKFGEGKNEYIYVDNRPEAYTEKFLQNVYITALQDNEVWQREDAKYHFNTIFFSHRDYTPWGQAFLIARVQDPNWAPVFVDNYNIIFLRWDNPANSEIIRKFKIPKSRFGIK